MELIILSTRHLVAESDRANEALYGIMHVITEIYSIGARSQARRREWSLRDGQKTLQALVTNYNKVTDEVVRATMDKLVNRSMNIGQESCDSFMEKSSRGLSSRRCGNLFPTVDHKAFVSVD